MTASCFRDAGWVWEGMATHAGVWPTLYGVGEGWRYFGVPGVNLMFHPNTAVSLGKLADAPRVVADISKWQFEHVRNPQGYEVGFTGVHDASPERIHAEAANLAELAGDFPNLQGGIIDDASNMFGHASYGGSGAAEIAAALKAGGEHLRLWVVVYANQLDLPEWEPLKPHLDVINLWLWDCREIPNLAAHVEHCARALPGKPIVVGSYLRDFPSRAGVPLELLALQYETMRALWEQGRIEGFNVLGAFLIDQDVAQAEWVRDFLAEHC